MFPNDDEEEIRPALSGAMQHQEKRIEILEDKRITLALQLTEAHAKIRELQNSSELAWAAGFFDGEGCVFIRTYQRKSGPASYLSLSVSQTDRELLERFQEAVGVGKINGPYHNGSGRKPKYQWEVGKRPGVNQVIKVLISRISHVKRLQIQKALALVDAGSIK